MLKTLVVIDRRPYEEETYVRDRFSGMGYLLYGRREIEHKDEELTRLYLYRELLSIK